jgi:uncharacterized membrane protein
MYTQVNMQQPVIPNRAPSPGTPPLVKAVLIAATTLTGLSAGVIGLFAHTIMPGLRNTDDRTFVGAYQAIDRAIENPVFLLTFFGALILIGVAAVQHRGPDRRAVLPWLIAAFVLYLVNVVITMGINVPLNDALKTAGDPDHIDVAKARADFHESTWVAWNYVRTLVATAAFVILAGVLATGKRA